MTMQKTILKIKKIGKKVFVVSLNAVFKVLLLLSSRVVDILYRREKSKKKVRGNNV
jgi:hypothetical protein